MERRREGRAFLTQRRGDGQLGLVNIYVHVSYGRLAGTDYIQGRIYVRIEATTASFCNLPEIPITEADRATKMAKPNPETTPIRNLGLETIWYQYPSKKKQKKAVGRLKGPTVESQSASRHKTPKLKSQLKAGKVLKAEICR